ncbi:MAG: hypothetical protein ABSF80_12275 [Chitinispirillaceae bacterium]|jgi:hypothetical protein
MKQITFYALMFFLFVSCSEKKHDNPVDSLPLDRNGIVMQVGDSWLYRQRFINVGLHDTTLLPDTIAGYSYFQATKDTTIDAMDYLIIEGRDYEVDKDSIHICKKRSAVHFSDSLLSMYEFNTGDAGYLSGVMKAAVSTVHVTRANYGTLIMKKMFLAKLLTTTSYDTSVFYDFVYPIIYPLTPDSTYLYRDYSDPWGNSYMRRKFCGVETIQVPAGIFPAYKFEYLLSGLPDSESLYDWVGLHGLLKRSSYIPNNMICDDLGVPVDSCSSYDIYELIGKNDIDPDTLVPWGRR